VRRLVALAAVTGLCLLGALPGQAGAAEPRPGSAPTATPIEHLVVMMQADHSFDNYFGTYPGANGIPRGVCVPLDTSTRSTDGCVTPYRIGNEPPEDRNLTPGIQSAQYDDGNMDGFVSAYRRRGLDGGTTMGFYDDTELPFYWNVADRYTLFDNFFSSARVGTRMNYFYWVTGNPAPSGEQLPAAGYGDIPTVFDRLQERGVPWKLYVEHLDPAVNYRTRPAATARIPLLGFARFLDDPELAGHIVDLSEYYRDVREGTLPAVSYVVTRGSDESPPSRLDTGQDLVRSMTSELARSRYWPSSAFLLTYSGWGGWYDHVAPPSVDDHGYGFRVPTLMISPYSRRGEVDHTTLDYTGILKFIEDNWGVPALGPRDAVSPGLMSAFDFGAPPRPPELAGTDRTPPPVNVRARWVVYSCYVGTALVAVAAAVLPGVVRRHRAARRSAPEPEPTREPVT
jgi:phospholipase C